MIEIIGHNIFIPLIPLLAGFPSKEMKFWIPFDSNQDSAYGYVVAELIELLKRNLLNYTEIWHIAQSNSI